MSATLAGTTVWVEIGFSAKPGDALSTISWTDVTTYCRDLRIKRGRHRSLDRIEAGELTAVFDNRDGRFDPDNGSSPYSPNVLPMRRIRVRANDATATTHTIFVGFIDAWPQAWRQNADATVTLRAHDGLTVLANKQLPDSVYAYEVAQDAPIHWYRLGEDSGTVAVDQGSKRLNGVYQGSPTLGATGLVEHDPDTAVDFDGTDDLVRVDTVLAGVDESAAFSVEAIINPDTETSSLIVGQGTVAGGEWQLAYAEDAFNMFHLVLSIPADNVMTTGDAFSTGTTVHVLATFDGTSTSTIYRDGSDDTNVGFGVASRTYAGLKIGDQGGLNPFDGRIDEVALYDSELSSARASAHGAAVSAPWNGDTSDERIANVLDVVSWPSADRSLGTGVTTFGDADINGFTALDYIELCAQSESGLFFMSGDGKATFIGRHEQITTSTYNTSQATFSDSPGGGEFAYRDLALDAFSVKRVRNEIRVQRKYSIEQVAEDATSQADYLKRTLSESGLLMDSDAEALARAQWRLAELKDPRTRVERILVNPASDTGIYVHALGLDLQSRITVERVSQPSGVSWSQECHIQGIAHHVTPDNWETTWWLSPADVNDYLILGDATFGKLGSNALAY